MVAPLLSLAEIFPETIDHTSNCCYPSGRLCSAPRAICYSVAGLMMAVGWHQKSAARPWCRPPRRPRPSACRPAGQAHHQGVALRRLARKRPGQDGSRRAPQPQRGRGTLHPRSGLRHQARSTRRGRHRPGPADNWFRTDRLTLELHTHPLHEPVKKITNSWNTYTLKSRTYNQLVAGPEGSGFGSSFFGAERRAGLFFLIIGASLRFSNSILNKSLKYCRVSGPDNSAFLIITDISCMNFSSSSFKSLRTLQETTYITIHETA